MRKIWIYLQVAVLSSAVLWGGQVFSAALPLYPGQSETFPFAPAAGQVDSTAISKDDSGIVAWASGFTDMRYGDSVSASFQTPVKALGPATGDVFDAVSLGRGGKITLTFTNPIRNGAGCDFAVFENSFSDTFLELAWVEVSSDGIHFVRFPNISYTASVTGSVDPTFIFGYASKYRLGFGTPFDLEQLQLAFDAADNDLDSFSPAYKQALEANFPHLDLGNIRYVRLVDIVGDGSAFDSEGIVIYEPYPTSGSAGLDLEAVAVLNQVEPSGEMQSISFSEIGNQRFATGSVQLSATASSGLTVSYEVLDGPAIVEGNILSFTGLGQVVVSALQMGDETYAPAIAVAQSFSVADEFQHIYFEPLANQLTNSSANLNVFTSSGLVPTIDIVSGPFDSNAGFPPNQVLYTGSTTGTLLLRASQVGGTLEGVTYAPADDVLLTVEVVSPGAPNAPLSFATWQLGHGISGAMADDSDLNGVGDFEEYVAGTDPNVPKERPVYTLEPVPDGEGFILDFIVSRLAPVRVGVEASGDLSDSSGWSELVPEIEEVSVLEDNSNLRKIRLRLPSDESGLRFWRLNLKVN